MDLLPVPPRCNRFFTELEVTPLAGLAPQLRTEELSEGVLRISLSYRLREPFVQDDYSVRLPLAFTPDFHWSPLLTPEPASIAEEHIFRTPALIARGEGRTLILLPSVEETAGPRRYLKLDALDNSLSVGMANSRITEHILYEKAGGGEYPEPPQKKQTGKRKPNRRIFKTYTI